MEVRFSGQAKPLADIKSGSIFGMFISGEYVRFLMLEVDEMPEGRMSVLCLGPFLNRERGEVPGPSTFYWDNEGFGIVETSLFLMPRKTAEITCGTDPNSERIPLGAVVIASDGEFYLHVRNGSSGRAWVNLATGKRANGVAPGAVAFFHDFVLLEKGEDHRSNVVFDSYLEKQRFSQKLSA